MSKEKQMFEDMDEMLDIIAKAREEYANDITDHTENEYIREGLLNANYRKQSEVARGIFEEIDTMIFGTVIPNDCAIISTAKLAELKKKYTEGNNDNR